MLKKVLIGVAAVVVVLVIVVATRPSTFHVERSINVSAAPDAAFAQVNDFHAWPNWSPWEKMDTGMKKTYSGAPSGQGSVYAWAGNDKVGEGAMTVAESRPGELVRINVEFVKPFEGKNTSEFAFKPQGNQTAVTWSSYGKHTFVSKAMCLVMNMEKMLGPDMEKGLAQMKAVVESGKS